ncbi:hypothetical protein BH09MYX1_BH09MYX1_38270 [soil metagenome]
MFRALRRVRASDQVADEVTTRILDGKLAPGDKLPGERELADQFQVNRSTVREAIKSLSDLGLVVARHGGGTVVQDYMRRAGLQILPHLFVRGDQTGKLLRSVLESRRIFAVEVTRLAAARMSVTDRAALEAIVVEMERCGDDVARFQTLDFDFYELLAGASENWVFRLITNSVRPIYEQRPELFVALFADRAPILACYHDALAALAARDADRAAHSIDRVMRDAEAKIEALLTPPPVKPKPKAKPKKGSD